MSAGERDFCSFELGDHVYQLAGGVIPEIAERLDVKLGDEPNSDALYGLVGTLGKNRVLREGQETIAIELDEAADLLAVSGVQGALDRSLWLPELVKTSSEDGFTVITGGVANWQDRTARLVENDLQKGLLGEQVYVVTGNRVMSTKTEQTNPNVEVFHTEEGRYPTETEYAQKFVLPGLRESGGKPILTSYDTKSGDEIADNFANNTKGSEDEDIAYEKLFEKGKPVTFARVANAGVQLAVQFREAVRSNVDPEFDSDPDNPDVFILTDSFPIARTQDQVQDPANYQSPYTGLRQAVLTAKMLHEAAQA